MQILVLGMHRSGTSTVARLINLMGASVGRPELLGRPAIDNSKGFWERSDVRDLNDEILAAAGRAWDDPAGFRLEHIAPERREALEAKLRDLISELEADRPWVVKDPRLSLTLDLWRGLLEAPLCIIPYRHPSAIAASLRARNDMPEVLGVALAEHYFKRAFDLTEGLPRLVVPYDRLVQQPVPEVTRIYEWLTAQGCTAIHTPSSVEIGAFVSPDLRHHEPVGQEDPHAPSSRLDRWLRNGDQDRLPPDWQPSASSSHLLEWHRGRTDVVTARAVRPIEAAATDLSRKGSGDDESLRRISQGHTTHSLRVEAQLEGLRNELARIPTSISDAVKQLGSSLAAARARSTTTQRKDLAEQLAILQRENGALSARIDFESSARKRSAHIARETLQAQSQQLVGLHRGCVEMQRLVSATTGSARWKVGDFVCRCIEALMLRRRPKLAMDRIVDLAGTLTLGTQQLSENLAVCQRELLADGDGRETANAIAPTDALVHQASLAPTPGKLDVIVFPVIDWHFRIQRPQHLARELARKGHRVLYLTTQIETNCTAEGFSVLESPEPGVFIVQLNARLSSPPNVYRDQLDERSLGTLRESLAELTRTLGVDSPLAIVDLPFWRAAACGISGAVVVYDCMDHHAGFSTNDRDMLCEEQRLVDDADVVVVTSSWLAREIGARRDVRVVRNGAEVERFARERETDRPKEGRPVAGYVGAISEWFDVELLRQTAQMLPEIDFVLVGDVTQVDVSSLAALSNVSLLGEVPYGEAPRHVWNFDVALIPFKLTELTQATNPVKAYEYLAAGKPIVATPLPELEQMGEFVQIASDARGFAAAIQEAISADSESQRELRAAWARNHDWSARATEFEVAAMMRFPRVSVVILCWNNLEFTRACLESIGKYTRYPDIELVVVDNASTDGTKAFLKSYAAEHEHVKLVLNEENLGFSAGNNCGLRIATGEVVVILNNDTYVTPGWLQGLVGHLLRNPDLGLVGPVTNNIGNEARIDIQYADMQEMLEKSADWTRRHPRRLVDIPVLGFFCCAMKRTLFEEVGPLDEQFGRGFFEDDDYCRRVLAAGKRVAVAEDVFVHHHLSASFATIDQSEREELFDANRKLFEAKWGPWKAHRYREPEGR